MLIRSLANLASTQDILVCVCFYYLITKASNIDVTMAISSIISMLPWQYPLYHHGLRGEVNSLVNILGT